MNKIRKIEPKDNMAMAQIIRTVMPQFGAKGPGYSIEDAEVDSMYEAYQSERSAYWVVEVSGEVRGGAGIGPLVGGDPTTCELRKMYFLESLRGQGFGKKLMDLCLNKAREFGFTQMYLETLEHMDRAKRLYEASGFLKLNAPMGQTGHSKCNSWYLKKL